MRICLIMSGPLPPREGIGFYVWNLARYLVRDGHQVQIITRGGAHGTTREERDGITIWRPPFLPTYPLHVHLHGRFVDQLVRRLEPEIDIFHIHSPLPPVISTKRPIMLTFHSAIRHDAQSTRVNSVYTAQMRLQAPVSYMLEQSLLRRADAVSAVSPQVADAISIYPNGPANVKVTWNGVDTATFTMNRGVHREPRTVLTVGRLAPGKGMEDFIHAAALVNRRIGPTRFLIVGDGLLRQPLQHLIEELGLQEQVTLLGHLADRTQLAELYQSVSAFALLSHHEGLPTVVLEAMACGCPVIATMVGGIPYLIDHGVNGLLVPAKAPALAADAICALLQDAPSLRELGQSAGRSVEERFAWAVTGRGYVSEYRALLAGRQAVLS